MSEQGKTKIDNSYYIDSDAHQLLLQKKSIAKSGDKKGEVVYSTVSYHGTLEEALNSYINIRIRDGVKQCKDVKELIAMIKNLKKQVFDILN